MFLIFIINTSDYWQVTKIKILVEKHCCSVFKLISKFNFKFTKCKTTIWTCSTYILITLFELMISLTTVLLFFLFMNLYKNIEVQTKWSRNHKSLSQCSHFTLTSFCFFSYIQMEQLTKKDNDFLTLQLHIAHDKKNNDFLKQQL